MSYLRLFVCSLSFILFNQSSYAFTKVGDSVTHSGRLLRSGKIIPYERTSTIVIINEMEDRVLIRDFITDLENGKSYTHETWHTLSKLNTSEKAKATLEKCIAEGKAVEVKVIAGHFLACYVESKVFDTIIHLGAVLFGVIKFKSQDEEYELKSINY